MFTFLENISQAPKKKVPGTTLTRSIFRFQKVCLHFKQTELYNCRLSKGNALGNGIEHNLKYITNREAEEIELKSGMWVLWPGKETSCLWTVNAPKSFDLACQGKHRKESEFSKCIAG